MANAVLVTGATGFIGKHLVNALKNNGCHIYSFSRSLGFDVYQRNSFENFKNKGIDTVFHLAGETFVPQSWERQEDFYAANVTGTRNVLDFCVSENAKIIHISGYIYGIPEYLPIDENHPVNPNNPYACSKWQAEGLCRLYAKDKGLNAVILRPFNIYGQGQDERFLIPSILKQIKERNFIEVNDATPRRDYLYIADFINACLAAMNYKTGFNIFNLGFGGSLSVKEIVEVIIECAGGKMKWSSLNLKRKNEIPETVADFRRINKELGWRPRFLFKEGIRDILSQERHCAEIKQ